jgi:hypothetical protein
MCNRQGERARDKNSRRPVNSDLRRSVKCPDEIIKFCNPNHAISSSPISYIGSHSLQHGFSPAT